MNWFILVLETVFFLNCIMSKRQRDDAESFRRDYEMMRIRRVQPTPPAPSLPVNVPNPEINVHITNIFELHDVVTPFHVVRANGTEVVGLHAEVADLNHDAYPARTITVLLPAIEVVVQYPMVNYETQGKIQCVTVQYSIDEASEPSSPSDGGGVD